MAVQTCSRLMECSGPVAPASIVTVQVLSSVLPRLGAAKPAMVAFGEMVRDRTGRPLVALLGREDVRTSAEQDDVYGGVFAPQGHEAVVCHGHFVAEVGAQERAGGVHVGDGQGEGGGGDVHDSTCAK
ncbi:hypothetical protein [Streptomyces sp. NBC_00454]|uniref:hypothetical protein n=1 Tax=Streptomyces sp. NBC_00454 TaxID=2975747 RepID=UPI0030E5E09D